MATPGTEISESELLGGSSTQATAPAAGATPEREISEAEILGQPSDGREAFELLPPEDLHKRVEEGTFNPLDYAADLNSRGEFDKLSADEQSNIINAYQHQAARGVTSAAVGKAFEQIPTVAEQVGKGAVGLGKRVVDVFTGLGEAAAGHETKKLDKSRAELASAVEHGGLGTIEFARNALRKLGELSPEEIKARFFSDLGLATQRVKSGQGQGALAEATGVDAESLKKEGIELDPEAIQNMSLLADPTNYLPVAGGFKILDKLGKTVGFVKSAAKLEQVVDAVTRAVSGGPFRAVGKGAEFLTKHPGLTAAGVAGYEAYKHPEHAPEILLAGAMGPSVLKRLGGATVINKGSDLLELVAKQAPKAGSLADRAAMLTLNHAVKPAVAGAIVGGTMAVPLAMLAENDDAAASLIAGGMVFGGAGHVAGHAIKEVAGGVKNATQKLGGYLGEQYQTLNARPKVESVGYGTQPGLDAAHEASIADLAKTRPADANIINTVREAFRNIELPDGNTANAEVYLLPQDVVPPDVPAGAHDPSGFVTSTGPNQFRIYLWKDATATFHEPGHLIESLISKVDPDAHSQLVDQVQKSFSGPARDAFKKAYEDRLGLPITDEQATRELIAESFSNMLRGHTLDGLSAPFKQRVASTLGGFLEMTGLYESPIKPEGTGTASPLEVAPQGTSPLGVGHSFNINQLGADFLSRLGVRVPNESIGGVVETPVRPVQKTKALATTPIEPRKVTPEDKALKNQPPAMTIEPGVDTRKWDEAEAMIKDPAELETFRSLRNAVEKPQGEVGPVRSPYFSVIEDSGQSPVERSARRMQQNIATIREELGAVPTDLREMVFKTTIPNRVLVRTRKDGSPNINIVGTSVEKIFVNATLAAREAAKAGVSIPIETKDGKITKDGFRQLYDDLTKYTQNQQNGYAGDGSKIAAPANYESDIPPVNTSYTPKPLEARTSQFVNLLQGIEPPRTTSRMDRAKRFNKAGEELTVPRNIEATSLARENNRPVLEAVNVRSVEGKRPVFRETGETIKELNPLRDEFAQKGVDLSKILHESVEELSLEHFGGAVEPVQSPLRGVSTPLATAGFMPKPGEHTEIINQMDRVSGNEMKDMTDKAEGGLTGLAYDIGLTVRDMDGLNRLKMFQEKWQKEGRRLLDEGNTTDALPAIMKAQFFREAYEAATNTGSAAGPIGFKSLRPGVESPMENAPEVLKQKAGFMPDTRPAKREIDPELEKVARDYAAGKGIEFKPSKDHALVDENRAKEVADWYDTAAHEPDSPEVQQSYKAFIDETMDQYKALVDAGYKIEPWTETTGEPYHNSAEAVEDIRQNKHLWYFPTENGFGSSGIPKNHPLLADSGIVINGKHLVYNDVFRAVHDLFGHGLKGNQFGPRGEFNAWRDHSEIYSDAAKPAMSAETLAQNSWVNFGPHLRDSEGRVPGKNDPNFVPLAKRPFAEQKATILPKELLQPVKSPEEKTAHAIKEAIAPLIEALKPKEPKEAKGLESGFMPQPENPDAIKEAAVRGRGKVFTGYFHADAMEKAFAQGIPHEEYLEDGFVTNSGEFLTRHEALQRAQDIGQMPKIRKNGFMELGVLERNEFDQHKAFMPKSKKLAPSKDLTSKGWILPNDEFVPLGGKFHHTWLQEHANELNSKFKTKFDENTSPDERVDALNKGFTRVNYERNTGTLHVETNEKFWNKRRKDTVFETVADNLDAVDNMLVNVTDDKGQIVDTGYAKLFNYDDSEKLNHLPLISEEGAFMPKREQAPLGLSDVEVKPIYDREEMKVLTQRGKRERFPEAVVPRSESDHVDYGITSSPRFKKAKTEEAAVKDFADQLVARYDQHKDEPVVQQGRGWYSEFTPKVKELFGDKAPEFVELLAATSPRNTPKQNFAYAVEAFDNWQAGKYDGLVSKFNEGLKKLGTGALEKEYNKSVPENKRPDKPNAATWLAWWIEKHDLIPKRDNGKLFGMNSTGVLKVLTRQWLNSNTGMKTRQFINNLIGADHGATIDMWAARTMREIGFKDFQDRWRILSENESAVSDPDFKFSQKVFADASKRLDMKPSELQAAMWFLEKKLWRDNGWGKADYGSFQEPLRDLQVRRNAPRQTSLDIEVKPKKP